MPSFTILIVSVSDGRTDESFPLETAYTVQNLGVPSEILEDNLLPLRFHEKYNITEKFLNTKSVSIFFPKREEIRCSVVHF